MHSLSEGLNPKIDKMMNTLSSVNKYGIYTSSGRPMGDKYFQGREENGQITLLLNLSRGEFEHTREFHLSWTGDHWVVTSALIRRSTDGHIIKETVLPDSRIHNSVQLIIHALNGES